MAEVQVTSRIERMVYTYDIVDYEQFEGRFEELEQPFQKGLLNWKSVVEPLHFEEDCLAGPTYFFRMRLQPMDPTPNLWFAIKGDVIFGDGALDYIRIGENRGTASSIPIVFWWKLGSATTPIPNLEKIPQYEPGKVKIRWEVQTFLSEVVPEAAI